MRQIKDTILIRSPSRGTTQKDILLLLNTARAKPVSDLSLVYEINT